MTEIDRATNGTKSSGEFGAWHDKAESSGKFGALAVESNLDSSGEMFRYAQHDGLNMMEINMAKGRGGKGKAWAQ